MPYRPCGRTTKTETRITKKTKFPHTGDMTTAVTSMVTSITIAPITAPRRLPSPPRTMMVSSREIRS